MEKLRQIGAELKTELSWLKARVKGRSLPEWGKEEVEKIIDQGLVSRNQVRFLAATEKDKFEQLLARLWAVDKKDREAVDKEWEGLTVAEGAALVWWLSNKLEEQKQTNLNLKM